MLYTHVQETGILFSKDCKKDSLQIVGRYTEDFNPENICTTILVGLSVYAVCTVKYKNKEVNTQNCKEFTVIYLLKCYLFNSFNSKK